MTELVNPASDGEVRTVHAVKKKWYDIASKTKSPKESSRRKEMTATGGVKGEVMMTPEELKVVEIGCR